MTVPGLVIYIAFPLLTSAVILAFVRLVRGPTLPDRVVALDLIATLMIGIIAIYAIATDKPVLLDLAIVLALISFLGTIAFAHYIEKRV
jgi:multicomponent Na+:H+ antiporter subunit F